MGDFKELKVWQKAKDLAVYVYKLTDRDKFSRDFGLRDQIRRAAISVSSNIAEGDELRTKKQSIQHLYIAKGSTAELYSQSIIAYEIGYILNEERNFIESECKVIATMLFNLIKARGKGIKG